MIQVVEEPSVSGTKPCPTKDEVFREVETVADFSFGEKVASVFDDMLDRSVPFYDEIQRMVGELAADFAVQGSAIYDLGCSTASSFLAIGAHLTPDVEIEFVGLDSSPDMLLLAERKLRAARFPWRYRFERVDLDQGARVENASVVLLVLTLQFLRPGRSCFERYPIISERLAPTSRRMRMYSGRRAKTFCPARNDSA